MHKGARRISGPNHRNEFPVARFVSSLVVRADGGNFVSLTSGSPSCDRRRTTVFSRSAYIWASFQITTENQNYQVFTHFD